MHQKLLPSKLASLIFIGLFFFSFQQTAEAQFRILNNTNCVVNFKVGQRVANCSTCNVSPVIALPPSGFYIHPASATCGPQYWLGFKYFIAGGASFGVSYNPGLAGSCGTDVIGNCGTTINANWFLTSASGAGPASVILN